MSRSSAGKLLHRHGAAAQKDLAPSVERIFFLSGSSQRLLFDLKLLEDLGLTVIKSLIYSGASP